VALFHANCRSRQSLIKAEEVTAAVVEAARETLVIRTIYLGARSGCQITGKPPRILPHKMTARPTKLFPS
jgi:hypothetical protein